MTLDCIATLAEQDPEAALTALSERGESTARSRLLEGELRARVGQLDAALGPLELALALAPVTTDPEVHYEARITQASVLAALGRYDEAIPKLAGAIGDLEGHPELAELAGDAKAELRAYRTLVSPKTLATWASVLNS